MVTSGSSPLVRGSESSLEFYLHRNRFIPARAGIGPTSSYCAFRHTVHPRSCGDRTITKHHIIYNLGSSPLVRGSVIMSHIDFIKKRFIPARAGIGCRVACRRAPQTVHPRSCGDRYTIVACKVVVFGSSPLVRGSVHDRHFGDGIMRFIPARAGIGLVVDT